jgi:hypothetical protein
MKGEREGEGKDAKEKGRDWKEGEDRKCEKEK